MTTKEATTGVGWIRNALFARNAKLNIAIFCRDLQLSADQVHGFIFQDASLPPDRVHAICAYLWGGGMVWDEVNDRLMPAPRDEPRPQGVIPQLDPKILPTYTAGAAGRGPQPVVKPVPKKKREGWLGGWF